MDRISRRDFLHGVGVVGVCAAMGQGEKAFGFWGSRKPNVLLIVVDDQGYADLGCAGLADDVNTPNIDRIAKNGVRFTQGYATSPICSPSRSGIETGCYQQRFGSYWYSTKGLVDEKFVTIAELLKQKDYVNGYVGKFHYGNAKDNTLGRNFPMSHGFDHLYGLGSERKHYLHHKAEYEEQFNEKMKNYKGYGQSLRQGPIWIDKELKDQEGFSTELITEKGCEFIRENKDRPFYLHLAYNAVHNFTHQLPEQYLKEHNLNGYHDWDPEKEDYYEWYKKSRYPNNAEGRKLYLGQLEYLDKGIGQVLDVLDELKLAKDTLIVYVSDNGGSTPIYANNSPLRGSKYTLYEGGIRVPIMFSWPGKFEKNKVRDNVISAMDIMPVICRAAGVKTPEYIDGIDITDLLKGKNNKIGHDVLVWDTELETAVRCGKWKLKTANSKKHTDYEMVEMEIGEFLYDLEADIGEKNDVAKEHPDVVGKLKAIYEQWRKKMRNP